VIVANKYQKHGPMLLTCECFGEPRKHDPSKPKKRNTASKKCNCPYMFRIYCFETPTKLIAEAQNSSKAIEVMRFLPGVYIYEYPNAAHTCNRSTVMQIVETFQSEKLYAMDSCVSSDFVNVSKYYSSEDFWKHAKILYKSNISQDKAFQILAQEGKQ